jgi:hypothetical protein
VKINNNPVVITFNCNSWHQRWPELQLQLQKKEIEVLLVQEVRTAKDKIHQLNFHKQQLLKLGYSLHFSLENVSPPDTYNGTWSRNRTRNICSHLEEYISTFEMKVLKLKEYTFPSDQSKKECNPSHLDYFLSSNSENFNTHIFSELQSDHFAVTLKLNLNLPTSEPSFTYVKKIINTEEMTDSKWSEFKNSNISYPDLLSDDIHSDMDNFINNLKQITKEKISWKEIPQSSFKNDFKMDNWIATKKITKIKIKKEKKKIKKYGTSNECLKELQEELYTLQQKLQQRLCTITRRSISNFNTKFFIHTRKRSAWFWNNFKLYTPSEPISQIVKKSGEVISSPQEVMEETKQFYQSLFQKRYVPEDLKGYHFKNDWMKFSKKKSNFCLEKEISQSELDSVLVNFSKYKAAGENGI